MKMKIFELTKDNWDNEDRNVSVEIMLRLSTAISFETFTQVMSIWSNTWNATVERRISETLFQQQRIRKQVKITKKLILLEFSKVEKYLKFEQR